MERLCNRKQLAIAFAARQFAQAQSLRAEPFRDAERRQRRHFVEAPYAPAFQGLEQLGSGRQQRQRQRGQKFAFVAVRNQAHTGESARGADGRIGIAGERKIGLHPDFAGAARDRRGHILRQAEKPVEARHVESNGIARRSFHRG